MPALSSSRISAVLAKLDPLDLKAITDLGTFLATIPDNRSLRGRWYSLAGTPVGLPI